MAAIAAAAGLLKNPRLRKALYQHTILTRAGLSERLFAYLFSGLVYPQIWEDPDADMEAMALAEGHSIVTIASGGCNVLAYLTRRPASIDAVDLNPAHIALNRLKLAAVANLPAHADLFRFFGRANVEHNDLAYDHFVAPHLDRQTRRYWEARNWRGERRIAVFNRNFYQTGLLGRFIAAGHCVARLHGVDPAELMQARSPREQRLFFEREIAPIFDRWLVRSLTRRKASLFGLGIPPAQYDELKGGADTAATVLRERLERLACRFPLKDNYFAWQAFARRYPEPGEARLPAYLEPENHATIRTGVNAVRVHHASITELLAAKPAASVDRFVLLDAQDWMTNAQLDALWSEIGRTATPGARVIFRTAGTASVVEGKVSTALLSRWRYDHAASATATASDRSAIYGGVHVYVRTA